MVIAVPGAVTIKGDDEGVRLLETGEKSSTVSAPADGVAQTAVQAAQHRRSDHEITFIGGQRVEYLAHEVLGDLAVGSTEVVDEASDVVGPTQRDRCETQARRPTLRSLDQLTETFLINGRPEPPQDIGGLIAGHHQVGPVDLDELAFDPEPSERQRRPLARCDRHPDPKRHDRHEPV